jgi:hypothetical protein
VNIDLLPSLTIKKSGRHEVKAVGGLRFQPLAHVWQPLPDRSPANCQWCRRCLNELTSSHNIIDNGGVFFCDRYCCFGSTFPHNFAQRM